MSTKLSRAAASPTKDFFVRMITRDITLEDSILDLIDNSIDAAWNCENGRPAGLGGEVDLSNYQISINVNKGKFSITDNCGGMSKRNAKSSAFTFGRRHETSAKYSKGVYGIGMKRAVFKIGEDILIKSTTRQGSNKYKAFEVAIDVQNWLKDDEEKPWNFELREADPDMFAGVSIIVNRLTSSTRRTFRNPAFLPQLRRTIERDYFIHLKQGLTILLNNKKLDFWDIRFKSSKDIKPVRFSYKDTADDALVSVEIIAGMAEVPPNSNEPVDRKGKYDPSGWYVICNGRVVLAADKSEISGWGNIWRQKWHQQYRGFIGIMVFTSRDARDLPLTTTKRSVDSASGVFHRARAKIKTTTKRWIDYTNRRKTMSKANYESRKEVDKIESKAQDISLNQVKNSEKILLPDFNKTVDGEKFTNISYLVPKSQALELAREFGDERMKNSDIGLNSFEFAYKHHVKEE